MTLHESGYLSILHEVRRDALTRAQIWMGIAEQMQEFIDDANKVEHPFIYDVGDTRTGPDGVQFTYTSESGQGDNLPRDGERKQPIRYHRGSKASDEGPL